MLAFRCVNLSSSRGALRVGIKQATGLERRLFTDWHVRRRVAYPRHDALSVRTLVGSAKFPQSSTVSNTIDLPTTAIGGRDGVDDLREQFLSIAHSDSKGRSWQEAIIQDQFPFPLDSFQLDALTALTRGESLVLSAPTGAGKTIVGEMAVYLALCKNLRVFYTTPLKALSNQKFYDFKKQFGEHRVGLLTGDVTVNRDADIIVMTTEIYRNMLYADSTEARSTIVTDNLFAVIFDEFHYLNDRERGTVWEESVINSPEHVLLVALSATMSNTADVRDWFGSVQGPTALIQTSVRPVPLNFAYCDQGGMTPLFSDSSKKKNGRRAKRGFGKTGKGNDTESAKAELKMHPTLLRRLKEANEEREESSRARRSSRGASDSDEELERMKSKYREVSARNRGRRRDRYAEIPSFPFVVRNLRRRDMLPCIVFIFSRAGCDRAATSAATEREELVSEAEREQIRARLDKFVAQNPGMVQADRLNLAMQGIASHHAGLLPLWKLCVEELFQDGLIKVVFATETLAAGINMPARTTVISALSKRAGEEGFVALTTSEVLQMAGRAGRRGKDIVGHSMVLRSRNEGALEAFKVLTADVDALESKFTPNYGMVLNLLSARPLTEAKKLVDRSFGNFLRQKRAVERSRSADTKSLSDGELQTISREKAGLEAVLDEARNILNDVDDKALRSYVRGLERVKAEKRALAYLVQQSSETDSELIEDTLTFAPPGTRLLLKQKSGKKSAGAQRRQGRRNYSAALAAAGEGDLGAELRSFYLTYADSELEDVDKEEGEEDHVVEAVLLDMHNETVGVLPVFAAVDAFGDVRLFNHTAVSRLFYDEDAIDIENVVPNWNEMSLPERSQWTSIGGDQFSAPLPEEMRGIVDLVAEWKRERDSNEQLDRTAPKYSNYPEVLAQQERVRHAKDLVRRNDLHQMDNITTILAAKRAIPKIEGTLNGTLDPFGNNRRKGKGSNRYLSVMSSSNSETKSKTPAPVAGNSSWDDFMSLVSVLQHYGFLDESYHVTSLGSIGAKVKSENELWTSLVLLQPSLEQVSPAHLGAILGATQMESSRGDVYIEYELSEETKQHIESAMAERVRLQAVQNEFRVDTAIALDGDLMGLVEAWASGISWVELMSGTSLQEGDACRILRRVLDLLRQVQYLPFLSEGLKRNARRAVALLDRFPVTDERTYVVRGNERADERE